ncbi:MAG: hypothetical protein IH945_03530 [Armatimonadetes bacterium]|nr:hypothetical protein [Armatimonadota bacterium]
MSKPLILIGIRFPVRSSYRRGIDSVVDAADSVVLMLDTGQYDQARCDLIADALNEYVENHRAEIEQGNGQGDHR